MGESAMTAAKRLSPGFIVAICFCIAALEGYDIQAFGVSAPHLAPELHLKDGWLRIIRPTEVDERDEA